MSSSVGSNGSNHSRSKLVAQGVPILSLRSSLQRIGANLAISVVYFLSAAFGLSLATIAKQVSPVWPPTGIALAALLLLGWRVWPGIAVGAFSINAFYGPWSAAAGIAIGNTLEAVAGAFLLSRYLDFQPSMERPRDVVALAIGGGLIATTVSPTIGVTSLCMTGVDRWAHFGTLWWTWWLGDVMGVLVMAPVLLIGSSWIRGASRLARPMESALFLSLVALLSVLFMGESLRFGSELKFLLFPVFVWSALRLGQLVTAAGLVVTSMAAIYGVNLAVQAVPESALNARLLIFESFVGVLSVGSLVLGALACERGRIEAERNQLLKSEREARSEAERLVRMKDDFVATLSHELRTPLTGLLGWTEVLGRGRRSEATIQEGLGAINRGGQTLARLIDEILDMSRVVSGRMRLSVKPMDLESAVDNALELVRPAAEGKNLAIERTTSSNSVIVRGDPVRLQQVFWNLLSNAIKFTHAGKVSITLKTKPGFAIFTVEDTGHGIKPEFLPHVFDRFRQADHSTMRRFGGLGIGLAIAKEIVQLHGGHIWVQSDGIDKGAKFGVEIPLLDDSQARAAYLESTGPFDRERYLAGTNILVVDDDNDSCVMMHRALTDCGAVVFIANTAAEALTRLEDNPHLLLSDISMPDRDGYDLIRDIRTHKLVAIRRIPAIAVTALSQPEDRMRALEAGYDALISKPINMAALFSAIAEALPKQ